QWLEQGFALQAETHRFDPRLIAVGRGKIRNCGRAWGGRNPGRTDITYCFISVFSDSQPSDNTLANGWTSCGWFAPPAARRDLSTACSAMLPGRCPQDMPPRQERRPASCAKACGKPPPC